MNQPYAPRMHPTLCSHARKIFGVKLYKNNARALLSRILSTLNPDWLQLVQSIREVFKYSLKHYIT